MLRNVSELIGRSARALDGEAGTMHAFIFDDCAWVVRYAAVSSGSVLSPSFALAAPVSFAPPAIGSGEFPLQLRRGDLARAAVASLDGALIRSLESGLAASFGWPEYWRTDEPCEPRASGSPAMLVRNVATAVLRNTGELSGYRMESPDGAVGSPGDGIVDDATWEIRYLVVDTGALTPGKKVLVSPFWISGINDHLRTISVIPSRESVHSSPAYDPTVPITRAYEDLIYDHYGFPRYWRRY